MFSRSDQLSYVHGISFCWRHSDTASSALHFDQLSYIRARHFLFSAGRFCLYSCFWPPCHQLRLVPHDDVAPFVGSLFNAGNFLELSVLEQSRIMTSPEITWQGNDGGMLVCSLGCCAV